MEVTKINYDGKFTVAYELNDGTSSAFRVVPELGRMIAAVPDMLATLDKIATYCQAQVFADTGEASIWAQCESLARTAMNLKPIHCLQTIIDGVTWKRDA